MIFLEVTLLLNLQKWDLNPCLSDWLACINPSSSLPLERLCGEDRVCVLSPASLQNGSEGVKSELSCARGDDEDLQMK